MPNRKRDDQGRFASDSWLNVARERPVASAAAVAGAAAVSAFLWTRRGQIGGAVTSGVDKLGEIKSERFGSGQSQEQIAEEALTLKETGRKTKGPRGPIAQQDIRAGVAGL